MLGDKYAAGSHALIWARELRASDAYTTAWKLGGDQVMSLNGGVAIGDPDNVNSVETPKAWASNWVGMTRIQAGASYLAPLTVSALAGYLLF